MPDCISKKSCDSSDVINKQWQEREREFRNECNSLYTKKELEFYPCNVVLSVENSNSYQEATLHSLERDFAHSSIYVFSKSIADFCSCNVKEDGTKDLYVLNSYLNRQKIQIQAHRKNSVLLFVLGFFIGILAYYVSNL